ncbi:MAG: hypothetical protein IKK14_03905 [Oscillospiraceae bacterium]|nr:hypothetical protein [Oscillospiraceae bacterium]
MKKIIALLLAVLMLGISVPAYAEEATPWYIHILHMSEGFDINSNGIVSVDADIAIRSGAYCTIAAKIQKETIGGWNTIHTFRATGDNTAYIEETARLTAKGTYKCVFTFTVYDEMDFQLEQRTFESEEIEYR